MQGNSLDDGLLKLYDCVNAAAEKHTDPLEVVEHHHTDRGRAAHGGCVLQVVIGRHLMMCGRSDTAYM